MADDGIWLGPGVPGVTGAGPPGWCALGPPGPSRPPGPPGPPKRCGCANAAGWMWWWWWWKPRKWPPWCPSTNPEKKMVETMNRMPATMATQAAARKTLGVRYGAACVAGAGAVAVVVRTVGESNVSLMKRMMPGETTVTAMRHLSPSYELKTALAGKRKPPPGAGFHAGARACREKNGVTLTGAGR